MDVVSYSYRPYFSPNRVLELVDIFLPNLNNPDERNEEWKNLQSRKLREFPQPFFTVREDLRDSIRFSSNAHSCWIWAKMSQNRTASSAGLRSVE